MKKDFHLFILLICILVLPITTYAELSSNLQIVREIAPVTKKTTSETYVDAAGNPTIASDKGYATIKYQYNAMNMVKEKRFLDTEGNTVNCTDGYAYVEYEYYLRRVIHTAYFDAAGNPANGPEGYAVRDVKHGERGLEKEAYEYDANDNLLIHCVTEYVDEKHNNRVKSKAWFDAEGQMTAGPEGYARVTYEYLNKQKIHIAYYNADGSLFFNSRDGYAEYQQIYDKSNRIIEEVYRQGQGELAAGPNGYARVTYTYLQRGKELLIMYYNADGSLFFTEDGYCGIRKYQKNAQTLDEQYYVDEGVPGTCKAGYSRTVIKFNTYNQIITQSYYDEQDNLVCPEGYVYAKIKNTYTGRFIIKTEYYGTDEKPVLGPDGYAVVTYKYAKQRISEEAYYAENGKTPINCKDGYAKVKYQYDSTRQCIGETYYDADGMRKSVNGEADELRFGWNGNRQKISESYWKDGEPANCEQGYHEIRTEYNGTKVKAQSFYDPNGNRTVCTEGYASKENVYNTKGKEMATLYYDENGELMLAPGKEYAYMLTIPEKDKKALSTPEEEEEETEEDNEAEGEEIISSGTIYIEYYGTDRKLMNLESGYAYVVRKTDANGRVIQECYYDKEGNKAALSNGYDEIRKKYTEGWNPKRIEYYLNGVPALYNDNYAAVEREYDESNNVIIERYFDMAFQPAPCKNGYEMIHKEYNADKRVRFEAYYDHNEQPMTNKKGVYQTAYDYNENGKVNKETYFDAEGHPMLCTDGYAGMGKIYNAQGGTVATLYYNDTGELMLTPGKEYAYMMTISKAEKEGMAEEEGSTKTNYIEYYGTDRELMNLAAGYAYIIRTTDEQGRTIREIYFDKEGNRALQKNEYDEIRQEYTDNKKPSRIEYYLNDAPVLRSDGYAAVERQYDEAGNVIIEKYYDTAFQPASCIKGYEVVVREYNEDKRVIKESYYDHNKKPMVNSKGVYKTAYEYNENGKVARETYFDVEGNPMTCPDGYAGQGKLYNSNGGTLATLYYNEAGEMILAPGKEYAYMIKTPRTVQEEGKANTSVYIEYYGTDRRLMNVSSGYAAVLRDTDEQGRVVREVYFDTNEQRAIQKNAYDEIRNTYTGDQKKPSRIEYYLNDEPVLLPDGYAAIEREYDEYGNIVVERYYDTSFEPVSQNKGYEMVRKEFNDKKQVSKEAYFENSGEPMVNNKGVYQTAYEYNEQGKVIREIYYDAEGQPMANNKGYIMVEREYDEDGNKVGETGHPQEEQQHE